MSSISNLSPDELDVEMRQFLEQRMAAMKESGQAARDIFVYFVGHGGFVGRDADFYLAIRRTRMDNPRPSGVQMISLADTLVEKARHLRRIIILDCCFAGAAFSAFQSEPAQVALEKTRDAFGVQGKGTGYPGKGTVLLCSSNHTSPSLLLPDGSSTMFTKALVDALTQGTTPQHEYLSLREVAGLAAQVLMGIRNAPRPIVHSPDQSEGDIADIPFFPNLQAEEERALLERRRLGPYRLLRLLGSGGMGEVYLAEDARIGQKVAIKVIRAEGVAYPQGESSREAARLFEREAKAIARLDHPNILPLYAYGEETLHGMQLTYLVMPYRKEGTLATWLGQRDSAALLSPVEVAPLLQQAAEAVQHAHNQHILHQDIKPTNFLIRLREDQPDRPDLLLADFGIAKLMSATGSLSQSARGTPTYMAPEQWDGHPVAASDQYALAIMVYELLVGHPPFQGNMGQVMRQHYMTIPPTPSSLNAHLSPAIDAVLLRALAKQPDERFPSVTAFARAFHEALQSDGELHATLAISRAEAESGTTRTLTLPGGRKLSVAVPAGVSDGTSLRLEGQGLAYYEEGPAGPLVLTITIPAKPSPPPLEQDGVEPTVSVVLPDEELPAGKDQSVPPARPEALGDLEPTSPAPHGSEFVPTIPATDVPSLPAPPLSPPTPGQTKRRLSPAAIVSLILLALILLGGISFGIYHAVTSGTSNNLTGVAGSGSQFVAVGDSGTILTSSDGHTWTIQTSGSSQNLADVVWSGSQFVAVGYTGTILTSPDGRTWTTQSSGTSNSFNGIAWLGSQFVVVGDGGTILTSPDGHTWTTQTSGTSNNLTGVAGSGSQFVAVGGGGTILTSPDGSTWTTQTSGTPYDLFGVAGSGSQFVAVGLDSISTSSDGRTWAQNTSASNSILNGVVWSGSQFVAVGAGGTILTSPDGHTWTIPNTGTTQTLNGVAGSGSQFVAVGDGGTILTSP